MPGSKQAFFIKTTRTLKTLKNGFFKKKFIATCASEFAKKVVFSCDYFEFIHSVPIIFQSHLGMKSEINKHNITAIIWKLYSFLHIISNFSLYIGEPFSFRKASWYISIIYSQLFVSKICRNVVYKL